MASDPTQTNRPIRFHLRHVQTPLLPVKLLGEERINSLFEFDLRLLTPKADSRVPIDQVVGYSATVEIRQPGGTDRHIHGLVKEFTIAGQDTRFAHYHLKLVPNWWCATLRTNTRSFQQKTAPEILTEVLGPFGRIDNLLTADYPNRNYTVQYQETDWDFANRIMQEEGILFYFRHGPDSLQLVLADASSGCLPIEDPDQIEFDDRPDSPQVIDRPVTWKWDLTREINVTSVTMRDSHFQLFGRSLEAEAGVTSEFRVGELQIPGKPTSDLTIPDYHHEGDYAKRYDAVMPGGSQNPLVLGGVYTDADRTANLRQAQAASGRIRAVGESNTPRLCPGHTLALSKHPFADDRYIVTKVSHEASIPAAYWAGTNEPLMEYRNSFEVSPSALLPRPARTVARPRIGGPLTAIVTGPIGQEIFVDSYGRVKVQFPWDREGSFDADSSCWVRVAQLWAGPGWGAFFWPRIGMEVVVMFEDGDPDRPLITGCVYNSVNMPPTALPKEATVGGIKSKIFGGDQTINFNAIYIHDTPGIEYIQVHSETSEAQHSEVGKYHYVGTIHMNIQGHL